MWDKEFFKKCIWLAAVGLLDDDDDDDGDQRWYHNMVLFIYLWFCSYRALLLCRYFVMFALIVLDSH